jgi:hypothetical protein
LIAFANKNQYQDIQEIESDFDDELSEPQKNHLSENHTGVFNSA